MHLGSAALLRAHLLNSARHTYVTSSVKPDMYAGVIQTNAEGRHQHSIEIPLKSYGIHMSTTPCTIELDRKPRTVITGDGAVCAIARNGINAINAKLKN